MQNLKLILSILWALFLSTWLSGQKLTQTFQATIISLDDQLALVKTETKLKGMEQGIYHYS